MTMTTESPELAPRTGAGQDKSFLARTVREARVFVTYHLTWRALAWADIRSKYRRTMLGPWWLTVTNGCMAVMMALISGRFLGADMSTYLPHFMVSFTIWSFISSCLVEGSQTLIYAGGMIKATNMPIAVHVMRMVQRNFIIFIHNFAVVPLVWLFYSWKVGFSFLLVLPGLALVFIFCAAIASFVAIACVRYRDIPPLVQAVTQLLFFVSPIIWMPDQVRGGQWALLLNPMNYLIAVVRDPVLGRPVEPYLWAGAIMVVAVTVALAAIVYARYRSRVVFWV